MDYLIPANSKKGQLYFNIFNGTDLVIVLVGAVLTVVTLFVIKGMGFLSIILKISPILITILLVFPVAHYHNVRVFLKEMYIYLVSQKRYDWRGWCVRYATSRETTNSNNK
jgi:hypothetical protein